jgi:hypothetical protein
MTDCQQRTGQRSQRRADHVHRSLQIQRAQQLVQVVSDIG